MHDNALCKRTLNDPSIFGVTQALRQSLLASLLLPGLALDLQHSTFYSQMKTFAKGEFGHARLGFYLTDPQNGQRWGLAAARVST